MDGNGGKDKSDVQRMRGKEQLMYLPFHAMTGAIVGVDRGLTMRQGLLTKPVLERELKQTGSYHCMDDHPGRAPYSILTPVCVIQMRDGRVESYLA